MLRDLETVSDISVLRPPCRRKFKQTDINRKRQTGGRQVDKHNSVTELETDVMTYNQSNRVAALLGSPISKHSHTCTNTLIYTFLRKIRHKQH